MSYKFPEEQFKISSTLYDYEHYLTLQNRQLYLMPSELDDETGFEAITTNQIVDEILGFNRDDFGIPVAERKPIRLYINSPGGDVTNGFAIISVIGLSQTPVYTINVGEWSSMAFLVGITGHKRYSLPNMTFLMHDGATFTLDSVNKAQDKMKFNQRYEAEVVRKHVLEHSKMSPTEYDALSRVEYYMLPEDALAHGFIDEIVSDVNTIL